MTAPRLHSDDLRTAAARLAFTAIRFEEAVAQPGQKPGRYIFLPSWREIPAAEVEAFLVALPSPALISVTTTRGVLSLLLQHELSGDRRRWAEKTFSNYLAVLADIGSTLGLTDGSRLLLEAEGEAQVYPLEVVRYYTQHFPAQVGFTLAPLTDDPRAEARLLLRRGDGMWSPGAQGPRVLER
ncbi:MAG TPA: hypothetical protein VFI13_02195 [Gemmatimonadales bacterium]|nr:hypothetical protein [Gemmatimonadales bacterium]